MLRTIAVGTDGSETASKAVDFAIDMARRYDARLVLISSYAPVSESRLRREARDAPEEIQWTINPTEDVDATLQAAAEKAEEQGLKTTTVAAEGEPADVLVKFAEEQEADVLVIGNKGMNRRVLGSVPNSVSHHAPCDVLVVDTVDALV
jgi:nucleotide-binding universal stress UspA family protein